MTLTLISLLTPYGG